MDWLDIFLSVWTGFLGSLLVVLFLYTLRPRIEISKEIPEQASEFSVSYGFKMINKTPYPIFDVQVIIELILKSVPGGQIVSTRRLDLPKDKFIIVQKFSKSDPEAKYAFRIRTTEQLREIWTAENQYLRVSVLARHAMSGVYGVFQQSYFTRGDIKVGSHQYGIGMHVQPVV
jgi:hypothetical protein